MTKGPYRAEIETAAAAHNLDPDLLAALVEQESNGWASAFRYEPDFWDRYLAKNPLYKDRNPHEVAASYGLMQLMFTTAVEHGFDGQPWELFNPAVSLEYGARVISKLLTWARSAYTGLSSAEPAAVTRMAVAGFNGGRGGFHSDAAQRYANQVMFRLDRIKRTGR